MTDEGGGPTAAQQEADIVVDQLVNSEPVRNSIFTTIGRLTGHIPNPAVVGETISRTVSQLANHKLFGHTLLDMASGAVVGGGAKAAVRLGLGISGVGTVQLAVLGAASGASTALFREYMRQRKEFVSSTDAGLRAELKNRLKIQNGGKLALAAGRGAVFGAVGGVVGGAIAGIAMEQIGHLDLSGIKLPELKWPPVEIPQVNLPEINASKLLRPSEFGTGIETPFPAVIDTPYVPESDALSPGVPTPTVTAAPTVLQGQGVSVAPSVSEADVLGSGAPTATSGVGISGISGVSEADVLGRAAAPVIPESILPTDIHGHLVSGSVADHSLTYDGKPWVLLENGTKNINHLFGAVGKTGTIDQQVLATKLQQATAFWAHGQLNPSTNPDLYTLFHLSNGTASIYNDLLDDDTFGSLKKLGIIIGK